jgi:MoxR-like ATPase
MLNTIKTEIKKVIVGQDDLIDSLLIGLITGGHILVESVPGLAKTTAINTLAKTLGLILTACNSPLICCLVI